MATEDKEIILLKFLRITRVTAGLTAVLATIMPLF
jgi:hypothetical protein